GHCDRAADRRTDTESARLPGNRTVRAREGLQADRAACLQNVAGDADAVEVEPSTDGELDRNPAPRGDADHASVPLVALHPGQVGAGQQADLPDHGLE